MNLLMRRLNGFEMVSFDLFDTLLTRGSVTPNEIKLRVCSYVSDFLGPWLQIQPTALLSLRDWAESELRWSNSRFLGLDPETTLTQIWVKVFQHLHLENTDSLVRIALSIEVGLEKRFLTPRLKYVSLVQDLSKKNVPLLLCTEMYLDKSLILDILSEKGLRPLFQDIYVSSELGLMKGSGRIYRKILEDKMLAPEKLAHVGDNPNADFHPVRGEGSVAIRIRPPKGRERRAADSSLNVTRRANSFFLSLKQRLRRAEIKGLDAKLAIGLVLPLTLFLLEVRADLIRRGIGKVYFLAREGDVLMEIYEMIAKSEEQILGPSPEPILLETSRASSAIGRFPQIWNTSPKTISQLAELFTSNQQRELRLDDFIGLSKSQFRPELSDWIMRVEELFESGLESNQEVLSEDSMGLMSDFLDLARKRYDLLRDYLSEVGVSTEEPIGIVDLGWVGSIPLNLSHLRNAEGLTSQSYFYPFATSPGHLSRVPQSGVLDISPGWFIDAHKNPKSFWRLHEPAALLEVILGNDKKGSASGYSHENGYPVVQYNNDSIPQNVPIQDHFRQVLRASLPIIISQLSSYLGSPESLKQGARNRLTKLITLPSRSLAVFVSKGVIQIGQNQKIALISKLRVVIRPKSLFLSADHPYAWKQGTFAMFPVVGVLLARFSQWIKLVKVQLMSGGDSK